MLDQDTKHDTVQLSVSAAALRCDAIAEQLRELKVVSTTTPNLTYAGGEQLEHGCRVLMHDISKRRVQAVWEAMKQRHALGCAHVVVPSLFSGCIYDFLRPSLCPGVAGGTEPIAGGKAD